MPKSKIRVLKSRRNESLFDLWSLAHLFSGIILGWLISPFLALLILVLWEPLEVLFLSRQLEKRGIVFGKESIQNSLSDIIFDAIGVAIGFWILSETVNPPFYINFGS